MAVSLASRVTSTNKPISNAKDKASHKGSASRIFQAIKDSCEDTTLTTINKPPFRIGAQNGIIDYQSCINGDVTGCLSEQLEGTQHNPAFDIQSLRYTTYDPVVNKRFKAERDADDLRFETWKNKTREEISRLNLRFSSQEQADQAIFIYDKFKFLQRAKTTKVYTERVGVGRCAEMASVVLDDARLAALKFPKEEVPRMLKIALDADDFDHTYLVVDSESPVVDISNNPSAVREYLRQINSGSSYICDKWNEGLFGRSSKIVNGLYDGVNYVWHSIRTFDVTPSFNFSGLPSKFYQFFKTDRFPKAKDVTTPVIVPKAENEKPQEVRNKKN